MQAQRAFRKPKHLSNQLRNRLDLYACASVAVAASTFALAIPSEAEIVYTKVSQRVGPNGTYSVDVNNDGVVDFLIQHSPGLTRGFDEVFAKPALGNTIQSSATPLLSGQEIGPNEPFGSGTALGLPMAVVFYNSCSGRTYTGGPWKNVKDEYLGLRFVIGGQVHYGWARLSVGFVFQWTVIAVVTGYAYETVPEKGLRAGQVNSTGKSGGTLATPNLGSLGALARGADGLALWRTR